MKINIEKDCRKMANKKFEDQEKENKKIEKECVI